MKKEIDARGQACPKPVIMTKKELDKMESGLVTTIVDNEIAKDNLLRLAESYAYDCVYEKTDEDEYYISISVGGGKEELKIKKDTLKVGSSEDFTLAINSDKMGSGEKELGVILMRSLIYTIKETRPWPTTIVLYNSGVYLTCQGSDVLDDFKEMEDGGVEIISCGTCLDYYHIADKLEVGEIGNMYSIYEKMKTSNKTITI